MNKAIKFNELEIRRCVAVFFCLVRKTFLSSFCELTTLTVAIYSICQLKLQELSDYSPMLVQSDITLHIDSFHITSPTSHSVDKVSSCFEYLTNCSVKADLFASECASAAQ